MNENIEIQQFSSANYDDVVTLWKACGISARTGEDKENLVRIDQFNPGLFLLAFANDNSLIGTVYATFDGRRGWINHLCVAEKYREKGLATTLLEAVEDQLKQKGCPQINLLIYPDNIHNLEEWYGKRGYKKRDLVFMCKAT